MKAYSYDYQGNYIGEFEVDFCQIEKKPILPAYSTLKQPNPKKEERAIFVSGKWEYEKIPKKEEKPKEEPQKLNYKEKRAAEYPEFFEYIDGMAKSRSQDEATRLEGSAQIEKYFQDILAVKKKYPKE